MIDEGQIDIVISGLKALYEKLTEKDRSQMTFKDEESKEQK